MSTFSFNVYICTNETLFIATRERSTNTYKRIQTEDAFSFTGACIILHHEKSYGRAPRFVLPKPLAHSIGPFGAVGRWRRFREWTESGQRVDRVDRVDRGATEKRCRRHLQSRGSPLSGCKIRCRIDPSKRCRCHLLSFSQLTPSTRKMVSPTCQSSWSI